MGYYVEYRDQEHEDLVEKLYKAKKAVCEAWEAIEHTGKNPERTKPHMAERGGMGYRMGRRDELGGGVNHYEY